MRHHAKREHLISKVRTRNATRLDALLHELFVLSYLLDSSIFRLIIRVLSQSQFARPRDLGKSLRFTFIGCLLVNFWPVLRHLWPTVQVVEQGFLLDFLGRWGKASRLQLAVLDILIFILQTLCLFIAYETHASKGVPDELVYDPTVDALESVPTADQSSIRRNGFEAIPTSDPDEHSKSASQAQTQYLSQPQPNVPFDEENTPIAHLRLRHIVNKIWAPPPSSPQASSSSSQISPSNLPFPSSTPNPFNHTRAVRSRERNQLNGDVDGSSVASPFGRFLVGLQQRIDAQRDRASNLNTVDRGPATGRAVVGGRGSGIPQSSGTVPSTITPGGRPATERRSTMPGELG